MRLRIRLLTACLTIMALVLALAGSALIACTFSAQLDIAAQGIMQEGAAVRGAMEAASVGYSLQSITVTEDIARGIAAQAGALLEEAGLIEGVELAGETMRLRRAVTLGGREYTFAIVRNVSDVFRLRRDMLIWYAVIYIIAMGICAAVLVAVARGLAWPLEELARVSMRIAGGEHNARAQAGEGETGEVAEALNRMADELTGQLERRDRFIADLSHEMRTPLTAMIGHAELIRSGRLSREDAMMAAQYVFKEGRRLSDMASRLMDMVLLERDGPVLKPLDAAWLAGEICEASMPRARQDGAGLALQAGGDPAIVLGDDVLLRALLSNLIDNALRAGAKHVTIGVRHARGQVLLEVRDDGCGMDAEALRRVTEPFYRVDKSRSRAQGGAGLGLALCERIARLHGDRLHFASKPGGGTRVWLALKEVSHDE